MFGPKTGNNFISEQGIPKQMNFRKTSKEGGGRGSYSIKKIVSQNSYLCMYSAFLDIIRKQLQNNFPKMRGGSKAVSNFSENSSDLLAPTFPKVSLVEASNKCLIVFMILCYYTMSISHRAS